MASKEDRSARKRKNRTMRRIRNRKNPDFQMKTKKAMKIVAELRLAKTQSFIEKENDVAALPAAAKAASS